MWTWSREVFMSWTLCYTYLPFHSSPVSLTHSVRWQCLSSSSVYKDCWTYLISSLLSILNQLLMGCGETYAQLGCKNVSFLAGTWETHGIRPDSTTTSFSLKFEIKIKTGKTILSAYYPRDVGSRNGMQVRETLIQYFSVCGRGSVWQSVAANVNMARFYQFACPSRLVCASFATEAIRTVRIIYTEKANAVHFRTYSSICLFSLKLLFLILWLLLCSTAGNLYRNEDDVKCVVERKEKREKNEKEFLFTFRK